MFFKALSVYRIAPQWISNVFSLHEAIDANPIQPLSAMSLETRGWSQKIIGNTGADQIVMETDTKLLPAAVINQHAQERIEKLEQDKGFKLGRKARNEIKEKVVAELSPVAFVKRTHLAGIIDRESRWLIVDTASATHADEFTQTLRNALGELPIMHLQSNPSMSATMTMWLTAQQAPGPFELDDECVLTATDEHKSTVRYTRHALDGKDVIGHLSAGKVVTKLGLTWKDQISFVIDEKLQISKVRFLDVERIREGQEDLAPDEAEAADFELQLGMLRKFLSDLSDAVGCGCVIG